MGAPTIPRAAPLKITFGHGAAAGNPRSIAAEKIRRTGQSEIWRRIRSYVAVVLRMLEMMLPCSLALGPVPWVFQPTVRGRPRPSRPSLLLSDPSFLFAKSEDGVKIMECARLEIFSSPRFDAVGPVPIGWWDNGIRHISNSKRSINVPDDLRGLKIRTPPDPATIDIFQALGAATIQIAFAELYVALQQKVVDGQENPPTNISVRKFTK